MLSAGACPCVARDLLRGLHQSAHLGIAIGRQANRLAVDPERHVVEKRVTVDFGQVNLALHRVGERLERTEHVLPVHPEVERKMVACPSRNTDEGKAVRSGGRMPRPRATRRHQPSPAHPRRLQRRTDQPLATIAGGEDDHLDSQLACPLGEPDACRDALARPRVDEQHRPLWRVNGPPSNVRQLLLTHLAPALCRTGNSADLAICCASAGSPRYLASAVSRTGAGPCRTAIGRCLRQLPRTTRKPVAGALATAGPQLQTFDAAASASMPASTASRTA